MSVAPVDDLVAWLTQIWDEGDALAKATAKEEGDDWQPGDRYNSDSVINADGGYVACGPWEYMAWETRQHIATNDPSSVLARIAAHRQILAECCIVLEDKTPGRTRERMLAWAVLRQLASAHRNLPGWRDAWQ